MRTRAGALEHIFPAFFELTCSKLNLGTILDCERRRNENIKRNEGFLHELGLPNLGGLISRQGRTKLPYARTVGASNLHPPTPPRRSSRIKEQSRDAVELSFSTRTERVASKFEALFFCQVFTCINSEAGPPVHMYFICPSRQIEI